MGDYNDVSPEEFERKLALNRAWVTDDELAGLKLERASGFKSLSGEPESPLDQALRMLRDNSPMAAQSLIRLAQHGDSETVRLRASVEILNRATQSGGGGADGRNPWDDVYDSVMTAAPAAAQQKGELEAKGITPASIEDGDLP